MNLNSRPWLREPRSHDRWRAFFARHGVQAPLRVTEHGYPSAPRSEHPQAAYLARSIPALIETGAARVFVTERDNLGGSFASEGLLGGTVADPPVADPVVRRKPAAAFAELTRVWHRSARR